jgi:hypothetical protein|tara:strand:+ start:241 stop:492 length:252 start_codon:yes stop_codon:yes gene_type:complete
MNTTSKTYEIKREIIAIPNTTLAYTNKLDYVCYFDEEGNLKSISKHERKEGQLSMKNMREGQHGFKKALKLIAYIHREEMENN